jgi:hypothetical protein
MFCTQYCSSQLSASLSNVSFSIKCKRAIGDTLEFLNFILWYASVKVWDTSLVGEQRVFCRGHTWSRCFQNAFQIIVREELSGLCSCANVEYLFTNVRASINAEYFQGNFYLTLVIFTAQTSWKAPQLLVLYLFR